MVLQRIGSNAYILDLPDDIWISPIFNVADLLPYNLPPKEEDFRDPPSDDAPLAYSSEENFSNPRRVDAAQNLATDKVPREILALTEVLGHYGRESLGAILEGNRTTSRPW